MGNVFTMLLLSSVVLFGISYVLRTQILYLVGASGTTIGYAESYLKIYLFGTIFTLITSGMNGFITAQGFPCIAMLTTMFGAITNLILDPFLIYGFHMGVSGAAAATVFSQMLSVVWVLIFLFRNQQICLGSSCIKPEKRIILAVMG